MSEEKKMSEQVADKRIFVMEFRKGPAVRYQGFDENVGRDTPFFALISVDKIPMLVGYDSERDFESALIQLKWDCTDRGLAFEMISQHSRQRQKQIVEVLNLLPPGALQSMPESLRQQMREQGVDIDKLIEEDREKSED